MDKMNYRIGVCLLKATLIFAVVTYSGCLYAFDFTLRWKTYDSIAIDHYKIYWGATSLHYSNESSNIGPGLTSYTVKNLADGSNYYFAMKAFDKNGNSSTYSNEVPSSLVPPPAAPTLIIK